MNQNWIHITREGTKTKILHTNQTKTDQEELQIEDAIQSKGNYEIRTKTDREELQIENTTQSESNHEIQTQNKPTGIKRNIEYAYLRRTREER